MSWMYLETDNLLAISHCKGIWLCLPNSWFQLNENFHLSDLSASADALTEREMASDCLPLIAPLRRKKAPAESPLAAYANATISAVDHADESSATLAPPATDDNTFPSIECLLKESGGSLV